MHTMLSMKPRFRSKMPARGTLAVVAVITMTVAFGIALAASPQLRQDGATGQPPPIFRSGITLVTTDVIVRDGNGLFMPDLALEDFVVHEDGQPQEIASLVLVHGGRVYNQLLPPEPAREGIVLPSVSRSATDTPGRIFVIFIDDLHLSVTDTPKVHQVLETLANTVIHEGDMFGVMSSGKSSIFVQMTYDRQQLYDAIPKVVGEGLRVEDMVAMLTRDPSRMENRWRATSTFKQAIRTVQNLEAIQNRRKVFFYVSPGYDFDPFEEATGLAMLREMTGRGASELSDEEFPELGDPNVRTFGENRNNADEVFSDTDLQFELLQLTTAANRANVSFYTVDPRGLGSMPDLNYSQIRVGDWNDHLRSQQSGLRYLAELTGGMAVVNRNTFEDAFKEIDAETSDYYILGFYSSNPDASHRVRELRVEVDVEDADVRARTHYLVDSQ